MRSSAFLSLSTTSQEQLALQTVQIALYNLSPVGRDQLLSSQAQTSLQNTVNNVNPAENLYADLGLPNGATSAQVEQAYVQKSAALAATTSAAGKEELAQVQQADATLSNPTNKTIYDQTGAQATVFSHVLNAHTLYIDVSSVAPTTIQEFAAAIDAASTTPALTNLIIDLRGNIGGDLSFAQEFLALFFGPNEYAFDGRARGLGFETRPSRGHRRLDDARLGKRGSHHSDANADRPERNVRARTRRIPDRALRRVADRRQRCRA